MRKAAGSITERSKQTLRIAIFSETFLPGTDGVVTRLCATLRHFAEEKHDVLLFAPKGAPPEYASAQIIGVPTFRFSLYPEKKFAQPWPRVGRHLREFAPHLIHAVNPGFLGPAAIYYAHRLKVPLIASYHTHIPAYASYYGLPWLEPLLWWGFRAVHNRAAVNLCPSRATLQELGSRGFRNLELWERGVDLTLFSTDRRSAAMRSRLLGGREENGRVVLYVGRLAREKGIERLRLCLDAHPDVHLSIVGNGPYRAALEAVFTGTQTTFLGYLFGEELAEAYASADGFVFPSDTETLGLVLYEAMASGLPVLAASSPATQEVLEHGRAGFLFDPQDENSLLAAFERLIDADTEWQRMSARAREIVGNLDWKRSTQKLLEHYRRLLETS